MSTNFPTSIDSYPTHATGDVIQASYDNNEQDALVAVETKLGVTGSVDSTTVDYKLSGVTGSDKASSLAGSETLTNKILGTGTKITLGSDATGDIYYRHTDGTLKRLGIGTTGQVPTVTAGGILAYATPTVISDGSYSTKGVLQGLTDAATSGLTIASGVVNVNFGTGANQIVKLDGSSKLPAVDGSALTNLVNGLTGVISTSSSSTNQNIDTAYTTGYPPKAITIYYRLDGQTNGSGTLYSAGIATYDSSGALVMNQGYFFESTNASVPVTRATMTFNTTTPHAGTATGNPTIVVTISVISVTSTGFTVRVAYSGAAGGITGNCSYSLVVS